MSPLSFTRCVLRLAIASVAPGVLAQTFPGVAGSVSVYFGKFDGGGRWALAISGEGEGRFDLIGRAPSGYALRSNPSTTAVHAGGQLEGFTLTRGVIQAAIANGAVTGSVASYALSGQIDRGDGAGANVRGYWRWTDARQPAGLTTTVEAVVGPSGTALVMLRTPFAGDEDGFTTIAADGTFALTLTGGARVSGRIDPDGIGLDATVTPVGLPVAREGRVADFSLLGYGTEGAARVAFTVAGGTGKRVVFRAVSGALATVLGTGAYLPDPVLELGQGAARVGGNDNWNGDDPDLVRAMAQLGALPLVKGSKDAAMVAVLPAGNYWLNVQSADHEATGKVLVEVFDLEPGNGSLLNFNAQGWVGRGEDALVSGFVLAGDQPRSVLVRAVGPGAAPPGGYQPDPLLDPQLEVRNGAGVVVAANDNWSSLDSALFRGIEQAGTFRLDPGDRNAALRVTLPPGTYTAIVRGAAGTTGNALVEVYDAPVPVPATAARLVIDDFTVTRVSEGSGFSYWPRLHVVETGGASTALVLKVAMNIDAAGAGSAPPFPRTQLVPAGGNVDLIQELYGEPEFSLWSSLAADIVSVTITFQDSAGKVDAITAATHVKP